MAYSELIKSFAGIRNYMRQFFVYGFRTRDEFDAKSARSYDNEKRRIESWLSDYMSFRQDANGKSVFLSVDSRHISRNPLYKAWKASSFTKNDISLHFLLLDVLIDGKVLSVQEILACIDADYLPFFTDAEPIDESTLRKKLKEYVELGLIAAEKQGKQLVYRLPVTDVNLAAWQDAVSFFSEESPVGILGSFLLEQFQSAADFFSFKHRYLLFALDSGILLSLLTAIHEGRTVEMEFVGGKKNRIRWCKTLPLKIYTSVQSGRQYLAAYNMWKKRACFFRLDSIQKIKLLEVIENYNVYQESLKDDQPNIWGVSIGQGNIEHIEMLLTITAKENYIAGRLEREKRCGKVERLDENTWRFSADVYDALELLPWLRTFIGRIISLTCSNIKVEKQFWADFDVLAGQYRGKTYVV